MADHPKLFRALSKLADGWRQPWQISNTRVGGEDQPTVRFKAQVGDHEPRWCDVGKAFALSEEAPEWDAVCYVNSSQDPVSDKVGMDYLARNLKRADQAQASKEQRWRQELSSGEPSCEVLEEMQRDAGPEWALQLASRGIPWTRQPLEQALRDTISDDGCSPSERVNAAATLAELEGGRDPDLYGRLLRDPDPVVARKAFDDLCWDDPSPLQLDAAKWVLKHPTDNCVMMKNAEAILRRASPGRGL